MHFPLFSHKHLKSPLNFPSAPTAPEGSRWPCSAPQCESHPSCPPEATTGLTRWRFSGQHVGSRWFVVACFLQFVVVYCALSWLILAFLVVYCDFCCGFFVAFCVYFFFRFIVVCWFLWSLIDKVFLSISHCNKWRMWTFKDFCHTLFLVFRRGMSCGYLMVIILLDINVQFMSLPSNKLSATIGSRYINVDT